MHAGIVINVIQWKDPLPVVIGSLAFVYRTLESCFRCRQCGKPFEEEKREIPAVGRLMANDRYNLRVGNTFPLLRNVNDIANVNVHTDRFGIIPHHIRNTVVESEFPIHERSGGALLRVCTSELAIKWMIVIDCRRPSSCCDSSASPLPAQRDVDDIRIVAYRPHCVYKINQKVNRRLLAIT